MRNKFSTLLVAAFLIFAPNCLAQAHHPQMAAWQELAAGLSMTSSFIESDGTNLKSEIVLLKFDRDKFRFTLGLASDVGARRSDLRLITRKLSGIAGINASFFDPQDRALGVLIRSGEKLQSIHRGGKLLTGVFAMRGGKPEIVRREAFSETGVELAVQSGPRLVAKSKAVAISSKPTLSRRSGIAITTDKKILFFITRLRFPGASLQQIQKLLLKPELKVSDALSFDGGGSSQLFIEAAYDQHQETFISGGDMVPVGLVAKRR